MNNIPGWETLTQEFNTKLIAVAEEPGLRKDLWLTCLNCGGLSAVEQRKKSQHGESDHHMLAIHEKWHGCDVSLGHQAQ